MTGIKINLAGVRIPVSDGEMNEYAYAEAKACRTQFNPHRKIIFINGMANDGRSHAESALALSFVQMCTVIGVYNKTSGVLVDLLQCVGDKNQFNGISRTADAAIGHSSHRGSRMREATAMSLLSRHSTQTAQVALFRLLRQPENRPRAIFAHSQGNLIVSNVLQAIAAVDGPAALVGRTVYAFGSPAITWPSGVLIREQAFTWDPVALLAGIDLTWRISKVGLPGGALNPITHSFLAYLENDPAFVVNRFRWGGLGVTLSIDEDGLARALAQMGTNTNRVKQVFDYLEVHHPSDVDDVAVRYVELIRESGATTGAVLRDSELAEFLIRVMDEGWTSAGEQRAIAFLRATRPETV